MRFIKSKHLLFKLLGIAIFLWFLWVAFLYWINSYVVRQSDWLIVTNTEELIPVRIWLILWAGVNSSWYPSAVLRDRLDSAIAAYEQKKIARIIVSWDNSTEFYDEPTNMKKFLVDLWIPEKHIYIDYAGFDTYDSIYRAQYIFWAEQLTIFTQNYHLKRAIYIARWLWLKVQGMQSDRESYKYISYFERREMLSRIKAFLEVEILKPKPKFLGEKIIIE